MGAQRSIDLSHAFTLIEVLVSILILSIGVLSWVATQHQNIQSRSVSNQLSTATELAQSQIEELAFEARGWNDLHADVSNSTVSIMDKVPYLLDWDVAQRGHLTDDGETFWMVTVQAHWTSSGNHSIHLNKLVRGE